MSTNPAILPSPLALRKLRKGEFCELYFFTNKGLADARATTYSTNDNALTLMQDEHGMHSFVPLVSAKAKQNIVEDKDLTWTQIDKATHCMVEAMHKAGWDDLRIQMHIDFWVALGMHSWHHHQDERHQRALIQCQAMAHRLWHDTLDTEQLFSLKYIQQPILDNIRSKIVDNAATAAALSAKEASFSLPLSFILV